MKVVVSAAGCPFLKYAVSFYIPFCFCNYFYLMILRSVPGKLNIFNLAAIKAYCYIVFNPVKWTLRIVIHLKNFQEEKQYL